MNERSGVRWGDVLATVTLMLTLALGWAFVIGRTFAAAYFQHFGLGLLGLQIPAEMYALYSAWVMLDYWYWFIFAVVLGGVAVWMAARFMQPARMMLMPLAVAVIVTAAVYFLGYILAVPSAEQRIAWMARNDYPHLPRVMIWIQSAEVPETFKVEVAELSAGCHRLLAESSTSKFLIRPTYDEELRAPAPFAPPVLVIPTSHIAAMRVLNVFQSCRD